MISSPPRTAALRSNAQDKPAGISRRSFLKLVIAAGGGAALASLPSQAAGAEEAGVTTYPANFKFAVMSDIHLFSQDLFGENEDFHTCEKSDRKMLRESEGILDAALEQVLAAKPNMVIVPGDLTKDGEVACHGLLRSKFDEVREKLAEQGVDTQFYVINGNHDLNNHNAKDFSKGYAQDAVRCDPSTYKSEDLWYDFGYSAATECFDLDGTQDGSLSYVARPCNGLTLIAIDTCKYNVDAGDGSLKQETGGHLSEALLAWVCEKAKAARKAGDVVIAMQHHGIIPHFDMEQVAFSDYLVDDYETVREAYADAGISAVFTGHMHSNDIASYETTAGNTIYDIETGSLITYPSYMRTGSVAFATKGDELTCTLTVYATPLGPVIYDECEHDHEVIDDIEAYGKERTLTYESAETMIDSYILSPIISEVSAGGIKPVLADLVGIDEENLVPAVWSLVAGLLPKSTDAAVEQGLAFSINVLGISLCLCPIYNSGTDQVEVYNHVGTATNARAVTLSAEQEQEIVELLESEPLTLSTEEDTLLVHITQAKFLEFLTNLLDALDEKLFVGEASDTLLTIANELISALLHQSVDGTEEHDVLALANFCYQDHLKGNETQVDWVTAAIEAVRNEELLNTVVGESVNAMLVDGTTLMKVADEIPTGFVNLIDTDDATYGVLILFVLGSMETLADLVDALTDTLGLDLGGLVGDLVPSLEVFGTPAPELVAGLLETLSTDTNIPNDHDFSFEATAALPDDDGTTSGGGSGTGSGSGSGTGSGGSGSGFGAGGNGSGSGSGTDDGTGSTAGLPKTGDTSFTGAPAVAVAGAGLAAAGVLAARRHGAAQHEDEA